MSHRRLFAPLLLVALLTGGCSIGFVYHQLDWLIPWHLEDYIDFDSSQSDRLSRRLNEQLQWHCTTQLDRYAKWLRSLHGDKGAFEYDTLQSHAEQIDTFIETLARQLTPDIAQLLASASDEQITRMMENLEEHNRELREEFIDIDLEQAVEQRSERMTDILEEWLGGLSDPQVQLVESWSQKMGAVDSGWLENRKKWQQQLYSALQRRQQREYFNSEIERLVVRPESVWSEGYGQRFNQRRESILRLLSSVDKIVTPAQRQHFDHEIINWAESFERLACKGESN